MRMSLRKVKKLDKLPQQCDLCKAYIGLYQPFYTTVMASYFVRGERKKDVLLVMCPKCFAAHQAYLNNRKEHYIHRNARAEIEGRLST